MNRISSREEALFSDVLAQPPAERSAFMAKVCGADVALLGRLVALVAAHEGTDSILAGTPVEFPAVHEERGGDLIGRYKLLQKVGEGGCGVVWMAEQEEPVRRRVALKVIKLGMDTKAVVARFEAERQVLTMTDHPNIAKVHDAGSTDTGRPFFVMELVRGIPITKYCDENHLTPTERLELFIKVCQAVQHAHQKGIIHRDLKPSNILVTVNDGAPTPKVIDFGIAKATQGRLTDATVFTACTYVAEINIAQHALADGNLAKALAFSADDSLLAVGTSDHLIHLWKLPDMTKPAELRGHLAGVAGLSQ